MRKLGATLLALPVYGVVYLVVAARSAGRFRALGFIGAAGLVALVLMVAARPAPSTAVPPSAPRTVDARLLGAVTTGHALKAPFTISFDAPMDAPSVMGALRLSPEAAVTFSWDASGKTLTVAPVSAWAPDTLYTLAVDPSARAADGSPLRAPVRAVVLTAAAGTAVLGATAPVGQLVALDTAFTVHLDRSVVLSAVEAAIQTEPAVGGAVAAGTAPGDYVFTPDAPLTPDTDYRISLVGLTDADGVPFAAAPSLQVRTVAAASVVRFRPRDGTTGVTRTAVLSVRFTEAMDRVATGGAFSVRAGGRPVTGAVTWAEGGRVLVFTPAQPLPFGSAVTMAVGDGAASAHGAAIAAAASGTFTVQAAPATAKPAPAPAPRPAPAPAPAPKPAPKPAPSSPPAPSSSGGSAGASASWYSVEVYYLGLMNCTRTGGWVTSTGACSSPGGRNVAPLRLAAGISAKVTRPYAKLLATRNLCNHWYDGSPGDRLRRAGFTSYNWGENIGCEDFSPYRAVLGDHLFFQSERPYNGGHYRNLMNALYTEAGVGVWVASGRVRLVVDFYRP